MGEKLVDSYYIERLHTLIQELEEELADYKEGTEGLKLCVGDLRDERDRLRKALEEIAYGEIETDINNKVLRYSQIGMRGLRDIATEALKEGG